MRVRRALASLCATCMEVVLRKDLFHSKQHPEVLMGPVIHRLVGEH